MSAGALCWASFRVSNHSEWCWEGRTRTEQPGQGWRGRQGGRTRWQGDASWSWVVFEFEFKFEFGSGFGWVLSLSEVPISLGRGLIFILNQHPPPRHCRSAVSTQIRPGHFHAPMAALCGQTPEWPPRHAVLESKDPVSGVGCLFPRLPPATRFVSTLPCLDCY